MGKMLRRNYLLPKALIKEIERLVKTARFPSESEAVRTALRDLISRYNRRADDVTAELDRQAAETAVLLPKGRRAGALVHETHVEEAHWA